ncbi:MAG: hypothetical protein V1883_01500 [Candidatus Omnitrophota bacterium]
MDKKGIALIMAVGVLALLAVIATSFALNMRLEYHAAVNYYNGVKARYFAESALERAIAELRKEAKESAFDDLTETWSTSGYDNASFLTDSKDAGYINTLGTSLTTTIKDEQRKVNINNALHNPNNLLLTNLFTELGIADVAGLITDITDNEPPDGYRNFGELKSLCFGDLTDAEVDLIKENVTVISYVDSNTSLAPVNINTCDQMVLKSVVEGITDGSIPALLDATAEDVRDAIVATRSTAAITSWLAFGDILDDMVVAATIDQDQADVIMNNCNPNRTKPSTSTTEFCFNSGGYYEVVARGTVTDFLNITQADRTISAIVKIYDIYCETTKEQFELGAPVRVTWLDSCPVRSDQVFGTYEIPANREEIHDSIKLGFWDDFNSDNRTYSQENWRNEIFNDQDGDGDDELITLFASGTVCDLYGTDGTSEWTWGNHAIRVHANEYSAGTQMNDVAWVLYHNVGGTIPTANEPTVFQSRNGVLSWPIAAAGRFAYIDNWAPPDIVFLTAQQALDSATSEPGRYGSGNFTSLAEAEAGRYVYSGQVRIFSFYRPGDLPPATPEQENRDTDPPYKKDLAYSTDKTFNIWTDVTICSVDVWTNSLTHLASPLSRTLLATTQGSGRVALYGNGVNVAWDDIRIIPGEPSDTPWPTYFMSQSIGSSLIPALSVGSGVEWGTITATVMTAQEPSWAPTDEFRWRFYTTVDNWGNIDQVVPPENPGSNWVRLSCSLSTLNATPAGPIISASGTAALKYRIDLGTTNYFKTPILEDITITYLPKVAIKSFSLSQ